MDGMRPGRCRLASDWIYGAATTGAGIGGILGLCFGVGRAGINRPVWLEPDYWAVPVGGLLGVVVGAMLAAGGAAVVAGCAGLWHHFTSAGRPAERRLPPGRYAPAGLRRATHREEKETPSLYLRYRSPRLR
jgi:hypothetical protein